MRKQLYLAIIERLKCRNRNLGIQHFSLWNNNLFYLQQQKAFRLPSIFIEFEQVDWSQLLQGRRSAEVRIRLHILTNTLATPEDGSRYQEQSLEHLTLIDNINAAMQGLDGDGFNAFMLIESVTDHDHESILHNVECFKTRITDTSAQKQEHIAIGVSPNIDISYK